MAWGWTLSKLAINFSLGLISNNPLGWAIGGPTSQIIKVYNQQQLNSSDLSLNDKLTAYRLADLASDYQWGLAFGIAGEAAGVVAQAIAQETSLLGKEAAKEIAQNSGHFTPLARELIATGQALAKIEKIIRVLPSLEDWRGTIIGIGEGIKALVSTKRTEDFLQLFRALILAQEILLQQLRERKQWNVETKTNLNQIREHYLELNRKNIARFSAKKEQPTEHRQLNRQINDWLKQVKQLQLELHAEENCCPQCRFC